MKNSLFLLTLFILGACSETPDHNNPNAAHFALQKALATFLTEARGQINSINDKTEYTHYTENRGDGYELYSQETYYISTDKKSYSAIAGDVVNGTYFDQKYVNEPDRGLAYEGNLTITEAKDIQNNKGTVLTDLKNFTKIYNFGDPMVRSWSSSLNAWRDNQFNTPQIFLAREEGNDIYLLLVNETTPNSGIYKIQTEEINEADAVRYTKK